MTETHQSSIPTSSQQDSVEGDALPPWHWLTTLGLWTFIAGLGVLALLLLVPSALPPIPSDAIERITMADDIERARTNLQVRVVLSWSGNHMIAGGFFMWLAGRVIDAFRYPGRM